MPLCPLEKCFTLSWANSPSCLTTQSLIQSPHLPLTHSIQLFEQSHFNGSIPGRGSRGALWAKQSQSAECIPHWSWRPLLESRNKKNNRGEQIQRKSSQKMKFVQMTDTKYNLRFNWSPVNIYLWWGSKCSGGFFGSFSAVIYVSYYC